MDSKANFTMIPAAFRLREGGKAALARHFLALDAHDRRLRFGAAASDAAVEAYVERIDFAADCVFAVSDDALRIVAAVHVALSGATAELGLSVLPGFRGKGLGDALLKRAVVWLRNRGVLSVFVHCIAENAGMMHLARKNGMRIVYSGGESDGRLELEGPTPQSFASEWMEDQRALATQALRHQVRWVQSLLGAA
jgi:GNAT superfamily N-acetyltransferase